MSSIRIAPDWQIPENEATPEAAFLDRRRLIQALGLGALALALPRVAGAKAAPKAALGEKEMTSPAVARFGNLFPAKRNAAYGLGERQPTAENVASRYNNFYEFTTNKEKVWELAYGYQVDPWTVNVKGLVKKPKKLSLDELFTRFPLEERLYRFRCVERWAMQVPWTGFPLARLIDACEPLGSAKYVRFVTLHDAKGLPGVKSQGWYPWPYFEGLRLDEARNEMAFAALGIYGHALPMQHGAPWRVVVPWKYGYKNPKSIVEIEFTAKEPPTFWNDLYANEYGFYSNIDPSKPHPRWSQRFEQDIGTGEQRETVLYNGYGAQVGALYKGDEI